LRTLLVTALATIVVAIAGIPMFMHPLTAYTGVKLHVTGALIQPNVIDVEPASPAYRAGLRSGDVVSCLSARDARLLFAPDITRQINAYEPGSSIGLCVKRGDYRQPVSFIAETRPPAQNIYVNDWFAAVRLAGYIAFLLCAVFLVLGHPGRATWTFFAYALIAAPNYAIEQNLSVLNPALYAVLYNASIVAISIQYGLLMQFAALVPNDSPPAGWRTSAYRMSIGVTVALTLFSIAKCVTAFVVTAAATRAVSVTAAVLVLLTVAARLTAMEREERGRFGWAAFAIGWAVIVDFLRQATVVPGQLGGLIAMTLILTPIALMYAILKRHVIDISFAISRTVIYAAVTTIVVVAIAAVDWATSTFLHEARVALALDALVTIGIALTLHRLHRRIEDSVDFLLFRNKYEAETYLNRLGRTLMSATQEETVDRALVRDPYQRFHLTVAALFRKTSQAFVLSSAYGYDAVAAVAFESDHDLVRFLSVENVRVNLGDLTENPFGQASIAIPIHQGPEMTAFAIYGIHHDGTALDPDELETLERLCDAASQAYTYIEVSRYRAERAIAPAG
jgi:predicted GNAT superfamily acetyltransferase